MLLSFTVSMLALVATTLAAPTTLVARCYIAGTVFTDSSGYCGAGQRVRALIAATVNRSLMFTRREEILATATNTVPLAR
ncbi:hypothetical protein LTR17_016996 [Elasticomyces elasticus]|nr:hypothetical protein LTR17_016996 [Elasticomyces elasticus]